MRRSRRSRRGRRSKRRSKRKKEGRRGRSVQFSLSSGGGGRGHTKNKTSMFKETTLIYL